MQGILVGEGGAAELGFILGSLTPGLLSLPALPSCSTPYSGA